MTQLYRHKWAAVSFLITLAHVAVIYGVTHYFYRHGMPIQNSPMEIRLDNFHLYSILFAAVTAFVALIVERPPYIGGAALVCSLLGYFVFVG